MSQISVPWVDRSKKEFRGFRGFIAGLAVGVYRVFAPIVASFPGVIFSIAVIGCVLIAWATKAAVDYTNIIGANPEINTAATGTFGAELTVGEISNGLKKDGWPTAVAPLIWPLQFQFMLDVVGLIAIVSLVSINAMFSIWWERKVAGRIQSRMGPMRVGGWHGWAQSPADGLKLLSKEDLIPTDADSTLFRLAPYLAFVPALSAFVALPFGFMWVFRDLDVALIFILAMLGLEVFGVILAGWASNNKWSVYGAMREACQMVSYEIPLGLSLLIPIMTVGSLQLMTVGESQSGGWFTWLAFRNPFLFGASLAYYVAALASCKRAPFDLPESESELVAGFHTEYSGFRWSLFFFAEYAAMLVVSALATILFFGAWYSPLPSSWADGLGNSIGAQFLKGLLFSGPIWFIAKCVFLLYVQMWIRWTLPRIRIDQVLYSCIQVMVPIAMLLLLGNTFWLLAEQNSVFAGFALVIRFILGLVGIVAAGAVLFFAGYGFMNRRRLVGTMAVDQLPGA